MAIMVFSIFFQLVTRSRFARKQDIVGESLQSSAGRTSGTSSAGNLSDQGSLPTFRTGPVAVIFYALCKFLSRTVGILLFDYRCFGASLVPGRGPAILASNHRSYLDPVLVGIGVKRRAFFLARDSLFLLPGLSGMIRNLNAIPIPRGKASSRSAIKIARTIIGAGEALVMFPEGTRSADGSLGPMKRGIELLIPPAGAAVVPAHVDGSFEVWPRRGGIRIHPIRVFFGTPLEVAASGADGWYGDGSPPAIRGTVPGTRSRNRRCADLLPRLADSYRSLEARARKVCWAGAAGASGRPRYFG